MIFDSLNWYSEFGALSIFCYTMAVDGVIKKN